MSDSNDPSLTPLLDQIDGPDALRLLSEQQLPALADELRHQLLHSVSQSGGHFAASMGVVELTLALHYLYDTPEDRLVWDVGHQAYIHKILTGRKERLHSIRKHGGLAPFPKREESRYDTFGVGHSSTSISAALGMSIAARHTGSDRHSVAIIGDGGMTAGMAFEALNHAGDLHANLLVILNDNNMSISPNVGALSNRWAQLLSGKTYSKMRARSKRILSLHPEFLRWAKRFEEYAKGFLVDGVLFEEFGFNYIGPIDGHDLPVLLSTLRNIRALNGPQFLHIVTQKGKGYSPAEKDPVKYHGVSPFDPEVGICAATAKPSGGPSYSQVFGNWLCDMAAEDEQLVAITPAMCEGSGLTRFAREHPHRCFDVGIAEQHSVTVAAGMACDGLKPVVAIYSTFLQRAYDQLIHDVILQRLPVLFAIDRAGLVGADGATHNGSYDLSFLRCLPGIVVMAPADENECRQMLYTGYQLPQPVAVRYPRGQGPGVAVQKAMQTLPLGQAEQRRKGQSIAILSFGAVLEQALQAGEALNATVVNMRFIKPIDKATVLALADSHQLLVTIEENTVQGGAGAAVSELCAEQRVHPAILHYGLPDRPIEHGSREDMLEEAGLTAGAFLKFIRQHLQSISDTIKHTG